MSSEHNNEVVKNTNPNIVIPESVDVLYMMYDNVTMTQEYGFDIYKCSSKDNNENYMFNHLYRDRNESFYTVFHSKKHNILLQYDEVFSYSPLLNLLLVYKNLRKNLLLYSVVFIDRDTHEELLEIKDVNNVGNIGDDLLLIKCATKVLLYSISRKKVMFEAISIVNLKQNVIAIACEDKILIMDTKKVKVLDEYTCKCCIPNVDFAIGNKYLFINFGTSGLILNIRTSEIVSVIKDNIYNMRADSCKTSYCDIIIFAGPNGRSMEDTYLDENNYFICGDKILRTKEFIDFLTIKSMKAVYKEGTDRLLHYEVETNKGHKGILSNDFRKLSLENVLNGQNILDIRFSYIRDKYLV